MINFTTNIELGVITFRKSYFLQTDKFHIANLPLN